MSDDTGSEHQKMAADAEREADDLKHQGDKLEEGIEATRSDWKHKQEDDGVPGAVPDPDEPDGDDE